MSSLGKFFGRIFTREIGSKEGGTRPCTVSGTRDCATRMISDHFFECRVKKPNPKYCEHSLSSGKGFICNHRDRKLFVKK